MRVSVDYLPAVAHWPGLGRYARELVRGLATLEHGPQLELVELGRAPALVPPEALGLSGREHRRHVPLPQRVTAAACALGASRHLFGDVDVHHRIRPEAPGPRGVPALQPVSELPPPGSPLEGRLRRMSRGGVRFAVFARCVADALARRLDVDATAIEILPVGCDHWRRELPDPPPPADPPTLLVLGRVDAARHPLAVLTAFEVLRAGGVPARLVWAGVPGDAAAAFASAVRQSPERAAVTWIDHKDEARLPALMARAGALVHVADFEGTPVTPLEAFSFGTPVVGSRLAAFEEVLDGEARLLATSELAQHPRTLADALATELAAAGDAAARARREAIAARYPWREAARLTVAAWERILQRVPPPHPRPAP